MSGKQISLSGEVHISATGVYTTWETIRVITDDPEQVHRYLAFREVVKMIRQMEIGREHSPMPGTPLPPKKKEAHGRER